MNKQFVLIKDRLYCLTSICRYRWLSLVCGGVLLFVTPSVLSANSSVNELDTNTSQVQKGRVVRGVVVDDASRETLIGVQIRVEGEMGGVASDIEGRFTITLPSDKSRLIITYVGYKDIKYDVKEGDKDEIQIAMEEDVAVLDEVVVVGYGEQKKLSITSSVSTIKGGQLQASTPNLTNALSGRITGVLSVQNSGEPGKNDSEFYIRGMSTFGGASTPLIMVDGVPGRSMSDVDPDEIESLTILKDASATAMYGAEGANGVILITSKRGVSQKTKISYRGEFGVNEPIRLPKFMRAGDLMRTYNDYLRNDNLPALFSDERISWHELGTDPDLYPDVDWYDLLKDQTFNTRHTLSFRGGGQNHRFYISGGYRQDDGIYKNTNLDYDNNLNFERYNLRSNIDLDVTPSTLLRVNVSGQHSQQNHPGYKTDDIFASFSQTPTHLFPMVYSDGTIAAHPGGKGSQFRVNPYNLIRESGYGRVNKTDIQADVELRQDLTFLTEGLRVSGKLAFDKLVHKEVTRYKKPAQYFAKERDENGNLIFDHIVEEEVFGDLNGELTRAYRKIYLEAKASYDRTFGDVHDVSSFFLYKRNESHGNPDKYADVMPFKKESIVGKASYVYDRRYSIDLTFGVTGSEQFAKGNRYGFFPAAGIAWNLAEESFFPWKETINELKFRASIGKTGNDKISTNRFLFKETWIQDKGVHYQSGWQEGGAQNVGAGGNLYEGRISAPHMKWEVETKKNLGLDITLLKGLVSISADYFDEKREDILLQRSTVSSINGFREAPFQNFGVMRNRGFEFAMSGKTKIDQVGISYLGNFTYTKNKVLERDEVQQPYGYMNMTGKEHNAHNLLLAERLYDINDFNISSDSKGNPIYSLKDGLAKPMVGLTTPQPGDIKYADRNNDGVINSYDYGRDLAKPRFPRGVYGFGVSVDYKGFYGSIFLQGAFDVSVNIAENGRFYPFSPSLDESSAYTAALDRWTQDAPSQNVLFPRLSKTGKQHNTVASTWWIRNGNFLRLKDAEIGYEFKRDLLKKIRLGGAKIYLQGHNLHTWDSIKFWDPEQRAANSGMKYPITRQFTLGLEVSI